MEKTESPHEGRQARILTALSAIVHTFLCAVWVGSFFSAAGTVGRVFCLLLTLASGFLALISWGQAAALWKSRRNRRDR
jgi:hypothetical protein